MKIKNIALYENRILTYLNIILFIVGVLLFVEHGRVLLENMVDVPIQDEWGILKELKSQDFFGFIFSRLNEHLIVTTKIVIYIMYKLNSWDNTFHILFNFILYFIFSFSFCIIVEKVHEVKSGLLLIIFSSIIPWENHSIAINLHFHLFLFFFILGLYSILIKNKFRYLGSFFLVISIFSSSPGIACAIAYILLNLFLLFYNKEEKILYILNIVITTLSILLWFSLVNTSGSSLYHSYPWEYQFWYHLSNLFLGGFGAFLQFERRLGYIPMIGTIIVVFLSIKYFYRQEKQEILKFSILLSMLIGLVGVLVLITYGRGNFMFHHTTFFIPSRYLEASLYIFAVVWILVWKLNFKIIPKYQSLAIILIGYFLFIPFKQGFQYKEAYFPQYFQRTTLIYDCLKNYYLKNNFELCRDFRSMLNENDLKIAEELNLSVYKKIQKSK